MNAGSDEIEPGVFIAGGQRHGGLRRGQRLVHAAPLVQGVGHAQTGGQVVGFDGDQPHVGARGLVVLLGPVEQIGQIGQRRRIGRIGSHGLQVTVPCLLEALLLFVEPAQFAQRGRCGLLPLQGEGPFKGGNGQGHDALGLVDPPHEQPIGRNRGGQVAGFQRGLFSAPQIPGPLQD